MHASLSAVVATLLALPFGWHYARGYAAAERARKRRFAWAVLRRHYANDGLPCTPNLWAHGEMEAVPGARICRRCGWKAATLQ